MVEVKKIALQINVFPLLYKILQVLTYTFRCYIKVQKLQSLESCKKSMI